MKRPPKGSLIHERRNGQFLLQVTGHPEYGLPWGQDRLVPIFLATLASRQQSRTIAFSSAAEMLDTFGMQQGGSQYRRLIEAFKRVFGSSGRTLSVIGQESCITHASTGASDVAELPCPHRKGRAHAHCEPCRCGVTNWDTQFKLIRPPPAAWARLRGAFGMVQFAIVLGPDAGVRMARRRFIRSRQFHATLNQCQQPSTWSREFRLRISRADRSVQIRKTTAVREVLREISLRRIHSREAEYAEDR